VAFAACGRDDAGPTAAARPRIVSLAPALTSVIMALGGRAHLVGVTSWCDAPGVPVVGDFKPRPEAVLAAEPDLVVTARYGSQAPDLAPLSALGLETLSLPLVTLDDMRRATVRLGEILGRDGAAVVDRFDQALERGRSRAFHREAPRVLLVYALEPGFIVTTGGGDHVSELIAALGAINAVEGPVTARLGLERVLELDPDLILHVAPTPELPDSRAALGHWSRWPTLRAVAGRRVFVFPRDTLAKNSPQLANDVPLLSDLLWSLP
jgi:ABC-type Fe3+-hydroxamate transport system substrate-binding protein